MLSATATGKQRPHASDEAMITINRILAPRVTKPLYAAAGLGNCAPMDSRLPGPRSPDATSRFTSRVDAYVKARPRYPREVLDVLTREIGFTRDWQVVDVGSGTGISSELFVSN